MKPDRGSLRKRNLKSKNLRKDLKIRAPKTDRVRTRKGRGQRGRKLKNLLEGAM